MAHTVDVFWSFRSPYSYLSTPDMLRLRQDFEVDVRFRPVLPIAVRTKESLFKADQRPVRYIMLDMVRRAEFLGMTFARPSPDPIVQNLETFEVAAEQPYIYRPIPICADEDSSAQIGIRPGPGQAGHTRQRRGPG